MRKGAAKRRSRRQNRNANEGSNGASTALTNSRHLTHFSEDQLRRFSIDSCPQVEDSNIRTVGKRGLPRTSHSAAPPQHQARPARSSAWRGAVTMVAKNISRHGARCCGVVRRPAAAGGEAAEAARARRGAWSRACRSANGCGMKDCVVSLRDQLTAGGSRVGARSIAPNAAAGRAAPALHSPLHHQVHFLVPVVLLLFMLPRRASYGLRRRLTGARVPLATGCTRLLFFLPCHSLFTKPTIAASASPIFSAVPSKMPPLAQVHWPPSAESVETDGWRRLVSRRQRGIQPGTAQGSPNRGTGAHRRSTGGARRGWCSGCPCSCTRWCSTGRGPCARGHQPPPAPAPPQGPSPSQPSTSARP